jgi:hypothetical protein
MGRPEINISGEIQIAESCPPLKARDSRLRTHLDISLFQFLPQL